MSIVCFRRVSACGLFLTAALLAAAPAPAAESPPAPYWSVHIGTYAGKDKAAAALKALGDAPAARAEKRRSWVVRVGAWSDKAEAEKALATLGKGHKEARVLQIENPVEWLLASGEKVAPPGAAHATPATDAKVAPAPGAPPVVDEAGLKTAAQRLDAEVRRWIGEDGLARKDGYVYTMDVAPLLLYAALRRDEALYAQLHAAARPLVIEGDAQTDGFVVWRRKDGQQPEVSGATEALWLARALWAGNHLLKRAADRALALKVLDGYARHAGSEANTWFVRKYYAFGTQTYASLSVLPNYAPDFVEEAEPQASAQAKGIARRSYALLQRAVTPSRLLTPLVQPRVGAMLPGAAVSLYAPNGLTSLEDSCAAAEGALRGVPQLARNVLEFASAAAHRNADGRLFAYFHRKDGHALGDTVLSSTGYACLARVAAAQKDRKALGALKGVLMGDIQSLADAPRQQAAPLYAAGPLLLAAEALSVL